MLLNKSPSKIKQENNKSCEFDYSNGIMYIIYCILLTNLIGFEVFVSNVYHFLALDNYLTLLILILTKHYNFILLSKRWAFQCYRYILGAVISRKLMKWQYDIIISSVSRDQICDFIIK